MAKKSLLIAFAHGGLLAAAAMGKKEDVPVDPHDPVLVPETYGRHLVDDRFAYLVDEKEEKAKREAAAAKRQEAELAAAELAEAELAEAEAAVTAATAKVAEASDDAAREAAQAELAAAEQALEKVKAA